MVNINRVRAGDEFLLESGEKLLIEEAWSAGGVYQVKASDGTIYSFSINGESLEGKGNVLEFIENETEEDKITYYIPKFDIDMLPVLTINGEDKIIYSLMELNGLEVNEKQKLKASYKYVIIALLQKKLGRDITVLKKENIICQSKEECEQKLLEISGNLKGANIDETETRKEFDIMLKKVLTNKS